MTATNLIIDLAFNLFSGIIAGIIAACGSIMAVTHRERMRRSGRLKTLFRSIISQLDNLEGHPASVVENTIVDSAVSDYLSIISIKSKDTFETDLLLRQCLKLRILYTTDCDLVGINN